jgi:hypothetical protein
MFTLLFLGSAYACAVSGKIYCDVNNNGIIDSEDKVLPNVKVTVKGDDWWFDRYILTDGNGEYVIPLEYYGPNFTLTVGPDGLPADAIFIIPDTNPHRFSTIDGNWNPVINVLISSKTCQSVSSGACWMTAGGVKFIPELGYNAAEKGPRFNFGGNTFPGCSPTAGDGGQWSFVDRAQNIHFQAWQIDQVTCGNVTGIPPGSTSPVTPFNYIDFSGWGTIKPIAGNGAAAKKAAAVEPKKVYFFAHFEDRNEPGNLNALPDEGAKVDRLYLRVWTDLNNPPGSIIYLINGSVDPATVDPVLITGGNIQIHISSCP